jgi:hypothetical protein
MATVKQPVAAKAAVSITLASAASASYTTSTGTKDNTTNQPLDLLVELTITPGTVAGNKQAILYALSSLDGTTFETGTNSTDNGVMTLIGVLPLPSNATAQTKLFSVAGRYGGVLPPYQKFVVYNDSGAAFSSGSINVSEVSSTVT